MLELIPSSDEGALNTMACPICKGAFTHVDEVIVAGRPREDGPFKFVHVDHDGDVVEFDSSVGDIDVAFLTSGRRHSIGLIGTCEICTGKFAIEFRQHKGQTEVNIYKTEWTHVPQSYLGEADSVDLL